MTPEQKQAIERFCTEIVLHDSWMFRETCWQILATANYDGPATLLECGNEYSISFFMKSGQSLALSRGDGGWSFEWGKRPARKSCENMLHYAEGGDIVCPDCGESV